MTYTKRVLIFIGAIVLIFIGLLLLQAWSNNTGKHFPKWPAIVAVIGLYYYLFPKKPKQK
jgi:hypothetical protein